MPFVQLVTNVKLSSAEENSICLELSKLSAQLLGKPERFTLVTVEHGKTGFTFGGSFDPAFALFIKNTDGFNSENNQLLSKAYGTFVNEKLGIPMDRGFIHFQTSDPADLGYNGSTIEVLFKAMGVKVPATN